MSNITHITGLNTSLSFHTRNHVQGHGNAIDPANNLGYGIGRIVRGAFDHLWHALHKMWAPEPTSEEFALRKQDMIFRNGLRECVQRLDAAFDNIRMNPHASDALKKIESLAEHYALYLKSQERPELRALQHKALQPLKEKISQQDAPQIKNALRQLLPVVFQEKSPLKETPDAKDTGLLSLADSRIAKTKRAVQQTGAFSVSFDLSTLNGTDGFKIEGLAVGDWLGISVSTAGDVNGDGKADLVLGAHYASPGGLTNAGTAYVVFGQASGWPGALNLTTLNGTNGFKVEGLARGDQLGFSVSTAGDLNGDGKADLVLGAYQASPGGRSLAGTAYVVFGQASGWPGAFNLTTLDGTNGFKVEGLAADDRLGDSVSTAGDLNGDGKADLVLGAYYASPGGRIQAGTAYVVFGQTSGWYGALNLTTLNGTNGFKVEGLAVGDRLSVSVSTAGDLNGDGKADLVLGAYHASPGGRTEAGTVYVVFGQVSGWPAQFNLATLNGINGFTVAGLTARDYLGYSVSTAGDLNGDGKADLVLGTYGASPGGLTQAGTAYVVFGQASGWPAQFNLATLNGKNGFTVNGLAAGDFLGFSVSTAGDVNGDGKADLVLGSYLASPGGRTRAGTAYVVFGQASGWPAQFNLPTLNGTNGFAIPGLAAGDFLGYSIRTTGDLNSDSKADLVLGAVGVFPAGGAYVLFGQTSGWPVQFNLTTLNGTNGFAIPGLTAGDQLGTSVSTAGDVNGDGIFDLLLGAPGNGSYAGAAYVIFGKNTLLVTPISSPTPMSPTTISTPITIVVKIPLNLNATFIPVTADILSISNNTVTVSLIDNQGYAIVFTSNYSAVPLATSFSPPDVTGLSIALGNGSLSHPPVFEGCNAVGQCVLSNTTTPLQQTVAIEGVDWKLIVPIVLGVAAVAIGGGLVFYFTYYRKLKRGQIEEERNPYHKLETRMKK